DLAEKMAEALLDENCATELVARGLARVKDFSLVKCARETLAVLESIFPS
ncbi:glycosyltransferase family 4 protein, partial [Candidatus Falkowbacteria bacterium]|nr:glycosyltransferase family 4 protein [Candidatus Falkowbacteria bacterium]